MTAIGAVLVAFFVGGFMGVLGLALVIAADRSVGLDPDQQARALEILRQIAPAGRYDGWHMEECHLEPEGLLDRLAWDQSGWRDKENWQELKARVEAKKAEMLAAGFAPTHAEMCEAGCIYPAVRVLLDEIEGRPS